eukprot:457546-Rhodomonas_salina.1
MLSVRTTWKYMLPHCLGCSVKDRVPSGLIRGLFTKSPRASSSSRGIMLKVTVWTACSKLSPFEMLMANPGREKNPGVPARSQSSD